MSDVRYIIFKIGLKYSKITGKSNIYLLICGLTSQMFLRMFKSREISSFNQDTYVAYQWHYYLRYLPFPGFIL